MRKVIFRVFTYILVTLHCETGYQCTVTLTDSTYPYIFHSYDGEVFQNHTNSIFGHTYTTLANVHGRPLAVGGYNEYSHTNKVEIFDITANNWQQKLDYPYHNL